MPNLQLFGKSRRSNARLSSPPPMDSPRSVSSNGANGVVMPTTQQRKQQRAKFQSLGWCGTGLCLAMFLYTFASMEVTRNSLLLLQANVDTTNLSVRVAEFAGRSTTSTENTVPPLKKVVRDKGAFPGKAQMGWDQVQQILAVLPQDGNLLVWGLGNDSSFWSQTTTGKVILLEDGTYSTNLIQGKRWFDHITASNPHLEAYAVDYTTTNSDASYSRYMGHPDTWGSLEMKANFPKVVLETRWDVILVDAPLGTPNMGPGRYQSLYMSKLLAERSVANARLNSQSTTSLAVHVFVDDYERKVEREFSQKVFGRAPVKVTPRIQRKGLDGNEQAHFVFSTPKVARDTQKVVRDRGAFPEMAQMGWDQVQQILAVLPQDGNLLVWGLGNDSSFWSQTTTGKVIFLEDGTYSTNLIQGKRWFDHITASNPHLEAYAVDYTTKNSDESYSRYMGHPDTWGSLEMKANFPKVVLETRWDVILVDAPLGTPNAGPGRYQSLYMSKLLAESSVANARLNSKSTTSLTVHVFVDDYERKVEREFSQQVFGRAPVKVTPRTQRKGAEGNEQAHFVFSTSKVARDIKKVVRDRGAFPEMAQMGWDQVQQILAVLPQDGNLLVWGLGNDSSFWSQTTTGKVIFLEDGTYSTNLIQGKRWFDYITASNPHLEAYAVDYTTTNSDASYSRYMGHPDTWGSLEMKANFPKVVLETRWDVILVDAPLGTPNAGPGRYQSLYMSKLLAERSEANARLNSQSTTSLAVHVFVDDYERKVEREFSQQVFGRAPVKVTPRIQRKGAEGNEQAHFVFSTSKVTRDIKKVVRDRGAFPEMAQMGWDQVQQILAVLPQDGNLLVWGLGNDSSFWSQTTTGKVIFLEDGTYSTNLIQGKRWFDHITATNPHLEAYAVDYTTTNSDASYSRYMGHTDTWGSLEMKDDFPKVVLETRWDVILVDAPLGTPNAGPGRYQSLYMSKLLAESSEANARLNSQSTTSLAVHVFVDDYERKVEREFSQQVFGRAPVKVTPRIQRKGAEGNEQAHFVFGDASSDDYDDIGSGPIKGSILVPWRSLQAMDAHESSPTRSPGSWVILLEVGDGYYDFFLNWLFFFNKLGIALDVVVIAEDDVVKKKLDEHVVPVQTNLIIERSELMLSASPFTYRSTDYNKLVSARATHILQKLNAGMNVIYSDVDTVWQSSPLPYLAAAGEVDAILQVDAHSFNGMSPFYCTGFMAFVSNERTKQLMSDWQAALQKPQLNQPIFNEILHYSKSILRHQPFPRAEFPNGKEFFTKFTVDQRAKAVVVHNNYIAGSEMKKGRFQEHNLWKVAEQLKLQQQSSEQEVQGAA